MWLCCTLLVSRHNLSTASDKPHCVLSKSILELVRHILSHVTRACPPFLAIQYQATSACAELPDEGVTMQAGDRLFDVSAQGKDILVDFDVFEEAGKPLLL